MEAQNQQLIQPEILWKEIVEITEVEQVQQVVNKVDQKFRVNIVPMEMFHFQITFTASATSLSHSDHEKFWLLQSLINWRFCHSDWLGSLTWSYNAFFISSFTVVVMQTFSNKVTGIYW